MKQSSMFDVTLQELITIYGSQYAIVEYENEWWEQLDKPTRHDAQISIIANKNSIKFSDSDLTLNLTDTTLTPLASFDVNRAIAFHRAPENKLNHVDFYQSEGFPLHRRLRNVDTNQVQVPFFCLTFNVWHGILAGNGLWISYGKGSQHISKRIYVSHIY